jgi:glycosyltransferase involved in cell wall biosynthesis
MKEPVTRVVVSGVNLKEGGILSVLQDVLAGLHRLGSNVSVTALVYSKESVREFEGEFKIIEYPKIKSSWFRRLYFEYVQCYFISKRLRPQIWLSLHDMTPNVVCKNQFVYCHNPSPFYKLRPHELLYDITFTMFCFFYKYLYRINIKSNRYVIVQQSWIRDEFKKMFGVESIVAYPAFRHEKQSVHPAEAGQRVFTFFYPSFPRIFKNFEVLLQAVTLLERKRSDFRVVLTITGYENRYVKKVLNDYGHSKRLELVGKISRKEVFDRYAQTDCLIFPSRLETWGLPLSEFKSYERPILAADLGYAREAAGDYERISYFDPEDAVQLAGFMSQAIDSTLRYDTRTVGKPAQPFFDNWDDLLKFLLSFAKND